MIPPDLRPTHSYPEWTSSTLTSELLIKIFDYILPDRESFNSAALVCKNWLNLTRDPYFEAKKRRLDSHFFDLTWEKTVKFYDAFFRKGLTTKLIDFNKQFGEAIARTPHDLMMAVRVVGGEVYFQLESSKAIYRWDSKQNQLLGTFTFPGVYFEGFSCFESSLVGITEKGLHIWDDVNHPEVCRSVILDYTLVVPKHHEEWIVGYAYKDDNSGMGIYHRKRHKEEFLNIAHVQDFCLKKNQLFLNFSTHKDVQVWELKDDPIGLECQKTITLGCGLSQFTIDNDRIGGTLFDGSILIVEGIFANPVEKRNLPLLDLKLSSALIEKEMPVEKIAYSHPIFLMATQHYLIVYNVDTGKVWNEGVFTKGTIMGFDIDTQTGTLFVASSSFQVKSYTLTETSRASRKRPRPQDLIT